MWPDATRIDSKVDRGAHLENGMLDNMISNVPNLTPAWIPNVDPESMDPESPSWTRSRAKTDFNVCSVGDRLERNK